jgi:hypothetical protein
LVVLFTALAIMTPFLNFFCYSREFLPTKESVRGIFPQNNLPVGIQ